MRASFHSNEKGVLNYKYIFVRVSNFTNVKCLFKIQNKLIYNDRYMRSQCFRSNSLIILVLIRSQTGTALENNIIKSRPFSLRGFWATRPKSPAIRVNTVEKVWGPFPKISLKSISTLSCLYSYKTKNLLSFCSHIQIWAAVSLT